MADPEHGDMVLTCFPQRQDTKDDDPDRYDMTDVLKRVASKLSQVEDSKDLKDLILNECSGVCFGDTGYLAEDFNFLEMFDISIGNVVSKLESGMANLMLTFCTGRCGSSLLRSLCEITG